MLFGAEDLDTEAHLGRMMRYYLLSGFHQGLKASETYFGDGGDAASAEELNRLAPGLGAIDFQGIFEAEETPLN